MEMKTERKVILVSLFLCSSMVWAKFVPVETARKVAVNHTNKNIQARVLQQWRKGIPPQQAAQKLTEAQAAHTYTAMKNDISVYYVFNLSPEGWAIISADDVAWPVIGYGDSGLYDPNEARQPPALTAWMDNVAAQIADAAAAGLESHPDTAARWQHLSAATDEFVPDLDELALASSVSPLIQSTWGQGFQNQVFPGWDCCIVAFCTYRDNDYEEYCPWEYTDSLHGCKDYCPTGCVATAMAQIMKYWHWPPFGHGWHGYTTSYSCSHECYGFGWREVNFANQSYNWSDSSMPLNGPSDAIARLMSDIGVAVEMDYTPSVSGAYGYMARDAFQNYFRYSAGSLDWKSSYSDTDWMNKIKADLDVGRPIWYAGFGSAGGHAFICDGYDASNNFHFNWGWDGSYDGWFTLDDLTPGFLWWDSEFSLNQNAIFNLEPISEVYVDDNYSDGGYNDGHDWGIDAFNRIQIAINSVYSGGTVNVAPGIYTGMGTIDLKGKAIHLYATGGPDVTTINGNGTRRGIKCVSGEGNNTIIEGFTITGGYAAGTYNLDRCGGGMFNYYSSPTVINCIFYANTAILHGGGMHNEHSSPVVRNCIFSYNFAGAHGGGIMNNYDFVSTITNCVFFGNSAGDSGGGICNGSGSPAIVNCTFSNNYAINGSGTSNYDSTVTVTNCIYWGDANSEIVNNGSSTAAVTYSNVLGGWSGTGNIEMDPCFMDWAAGDFRLKFGSPCLDAGNNTAVPNGITCDLDGLLRYVDACVPDTGSGTPPIVDMGAYEFQHTWANVQNRLTNPGFETGNADGWITNWGFTLTAVTDPVHEGTYSALTGNRTAAWQGAWQSVLGKMSDGKTYHISGWVRLQSEESAYVALTLKYVDSIGTHYYGVDNATAANDQWTHLDGTYVVDVNEPTEMYLYFEGPDAGVDFYVDDVSVTEVIGDTDHSGDVDLVDFSIFGSYFGLDCSVQDCGPANLEDCDCTINLFDLALFAADWLTGIE